MDIRKIQRSGTTYYIYLPASWCRENNITTKTMVYLERTPDGGLVVNVGNRTNSLPTLSLSVCDNSPDVINNMIIASYINPVKSFELKLRESIDPKQMLDHQKTFRGLDFLEFGERTVFCHTTLSVEEPDVLLSSMIKKIIAILRLSLQESAHELVDKYEEEIDKSNLLIRKAIIASLMYKKSFKLRQVDLYYIGMISRALERFTDLIIKMKADEEFLQMLMKMMRKVDEILPDMDQTKVIAYVKEVCKYPRPDVVDLDSYSRERVLSLLEHIGEVLSDWMVTNKIEE